MAAIALPPDDQEMTKMLKDMTRADWLTRRWVNRERPAAMPLS
jgi:hypothetical protein